MADNSRAMSTWHHVRNLNTYELAAIAKLTRTEAQNSWMVCTTQTHIITRMVEVRISRKLSPYAYVSTHVSQQVCFFNHSVKLL